MTRPTFRQLLDKAGFDWQSGQVIIQTVRENEDYWGEGRFLLVTQCEKVGQLASPGMIDVPIDDNTGCPKHLYMAADEHRLYFLEHYDSMIALCVVEREPSRYLDTGNVMPYPGGN